MTKEHQISKFLPFKPPFHPFREWFMKNPFFVDTYIMIGTYTPNFTFLSPVVSALRWSSVSQFLLIYIYIYIYIHGVKNYVYNVSGMIEKVKTNIFFIWQKFGLCTVLPLDGFTGRCLDFHHDMRRLVLFVLLCLQQVKRVITLSTKTCYDKYIKYVCVYYPFLCHSITTWRFPFSVVHCTQLIHHRWLSTL